MEYSEIRQIIAHFKSKGFSVLAAPAQNKRYIEVEAECNIVQFEETLKELKLTPVGMAAIVKGRKQFYTAWVKPDGS